MPHPQGSRNLQATLVALALGSGFAWGQDFGTAELPADLADALIEKIRQSGPIPVADYMEAANGFYYASHDPFDQNVAITKRVVEKAHAKGISVEAELGMLGGVEEDIKVEEGNACLTDPAEAEAFVKATGCDSLACAIGTSHGAFKFKGKQSLHFDVLEKIKARLPRFPLVMHGSSSVPQEEVARINAAGGQIAGSMGVDVNEYLPAAKLGVTKINIDTDGRLVWTRVHREYFRDHPSEFDFRPPGKVFIEEYAKFIASRNQLLGSAGQLEDLRKSLGQ